MSTLDYCAKSFAFINVFVEQRCFRVGNFNRELDSEMVAICLFNELLHFFV